MTVEQHSATPHGPVQPSSSHGSSGSIKEKHQGVKFKNFFGPKILSVPISKVDSGTKTGKSSSPDGGTAAVGHGQVQGVHGNDKGPGSEVHGSHVSQKSNKSHDTNPHSNDHAANGPNTSPSKASSAHPHSTTKSVLPLGVPHLQFTPFACLLLFNYLMQNYSLLSIISFLGACTIGIMFLIVNLWSFVATWLKSSIKHPTKY